MLLIVVEILTMEKPNNSNSPVVLENPSDASWDFFIPVLLHGKLVTLFDSHTNISNLCNSLSSEYLFFSSTCLQRETFSVDLWENFKPHLSRRCIYNQATSNTLPSHFTPWKRNPLYLTLQVNFSKWDWPKLHNCITYRFNLQV